MKNVLFSTAFALIACIVLYQIPSNQIDIEEKKAIDNPIDEGTFMMRAFPDDYVNLEAYDSALKKAKENWLNQLASRGATGKWTTQGPFNIGGRINTIAIHPQNEQIIYVGYSQGGVFKTTDGGLNWSPIFDQQTSLSIGDIELDPQNPNIIYVGTGDPNIGFYSQVGNGLWKSEDAGATWTYLGLKEQRIISRIEVNPTNPNELFAATMGVPFVRNNQRGLYKSIDGGKTWQQKLFVSDSCGVIDFVMNPQNPKIIYAATWNRIRNNSVSLIGGQDAGIYKTIDGGDNWTKLGGGLPTGSFSRVNLAIYEKNPNILLSVFVNSTSLNHEGIYKSQDAGNTWEQIPTDFQLNGLPGSALGGFGWYFGRVKFNPNDPNDFYLLGVDLWRTKDNGNNWDMATPFWSSYEVHADKHDLVYTPSGKILLATDGGLYRSDDDTETWADIERIAGTQFYRVAFNEDEPDMYYGGAQDNGTTAGNENLAEWDRLWGGDGFQARFDKNIKGLHFYETQFGNIVAFDQNSGQVLAVDDAAWATDRKHWDMPYFLSVHEKNCMIVGTQKVWKGKYTYENDELLFEWEAISEDLTDNNNRPGSGNTISSIEESSLQANLLFAGTADANVWRFKNGNWVNISAGLPERYITRVTPSPSDVNNVYVSLSGYRENELTPHLWKSSNQGDNWISISGDLPPLGVNDIFVLPNNKDSVLFVATDGGVYYSKNTGKNWLRLGDNMPFVPVYDIEYQPIRNQIFAGSYARSILSFDLKQIGVDTKTIISQKDLVAENAVQVYPSLFQQQLTIKSIDYKISQIECFDANGRLIFNRQDNENQITLEQPSLVPGTYILAIILDNKKKIIKKVVKI
jgi:photosystem II stability/assembly factor-like uncharacterized protein